jgi:hypothetical protein
VELRAISFGQIVAISVWVPPVVDYLRSQFGPKIEEMCTPRIHHDSPDLCQPLSLVNTTYRATNKGYAQAVDDDDEDTEGQMPHRNSYPYFAESHIELSANITPPNEFQLKSRGTRDFEDTRHDYRSPTPLLIVQILRGAFIHLEVQAVLPEVFGIMSWYSPSRSLSRSCFCFSTLKSTNGVPPSISKYQTPRAVLNCRQEAKLMATNCDGWFRWLRHMLGCKDPREH